MFYRTGLASLLVSSYVLLDVLPAQAQNNTLEQAWALAAKGDRKSAINLCQQLIREKPADADARLLMGSLESEEGLREEAMRDLTEATRLRPRSSDAFNTLGEAYLHFEDVEGARAAFQKAVTLNSNSGIAQQNLGAVLLRSGDLTAAADHLDRAVSLLKKPEDAAESHYLRARIYSLQSHFADAAAHLRMAIALRDRFPEAWSDLGVACRAAGEDDAVLPAFKKAVELDAGDAVSQYRLGAEYLRIGQPQLAVGPLQEASRLNPDDQSALNSLQMAFRQLGRMQEAATVKQKLADVLQRRDRKSQDAMKALQANNEGAELEKSGKFAEALIRYREAVSLNPEHAGVRTNYGILLLRLGRWTDGLTELHTALESNPGDGQLKAVLEDALTKAPPNLLPDWAKQARQQ